jgi:hypothetical protein
LTPPTPVCGGGVAVLVHALRVFRKRWLLWWCTLGNGRAVFR